MIMIERIERIIFLERSEEKNLKQSLIQNSENEKGKKRIEIRKL